MNEQALIALCKQQDRKAQQLLFEQFAPKMLGVCRRYIKNESEAEDAMIEGLFRVMTHLDQYQGVGSFEGWVRRAVINSCLMILRKKHELALTTDLERLDTPIYISVEDDLAVQDILNLLDELPVGYRTVFNLYAIEGYKHREIAELLGISINTSKSQFLLAKERLQTLYVEKYNILNRYK